jgi:hypothetical protein
MKTLSKGFTLTPISRKAPRGVHVARWVRPSSEGCAAEMPAETACDLGHYLVVGQLKQPGESRIIDVAEDGGAAASRSDRARFKPRLESAVGPPEV